MNSRHEETLEELEAQLAAAEREVEAAERNAREAEAAYRATTDGLGESLRGIELAQQSGADKETIGRLMKLHVEAENAARAEYEKRRSLWGDRDDDGPLFACPMGGGDKTFRRWVITGKVIGTYRAVDARPESVKVGLLRIGKDGSARRTWVRIPAPAEAGDITLRGVLSAARAIPNERKKLERWLTD